jgi:hypothetical protein
LNVLPPATAEHVMVRPPRKIVVKPLLTCPKCKIELRLFGIESESASRDIYTFECTKCGALEIRGVRVT